MQGHAVSPRPDQPARAKRAVRLVATATALLAVALLLVACAWAAFASMPAMSREEIFEIPKGTWARRMSGEKLEILPDEIHLTLGLRDTLVLRNLDDVPQTFGPTLMMPGQSFSLPFALASSYPFACTAHASGQMTVVVHPFPDTPWARLRWRLREWTKTRTGN